MKNKFFSTIDEWSIEHIDSSFDYIILNFNKNPNYVATLNKLNSSNFENLSKDLSIRTGISSFNKQLIFQNMITQKL